jgi:DNA-binding PadR family transcriptional regulator
MVRRTDAGAVRDPADLLPLSPPVFAVLLTLAADTMHGYAIMQELERRTGGRETLLPGSLYATIARMVEEGLIQEVTSRRGTGGDRRRRYYRATRWGRAVARAEAQRLGRLVELARQQNLLPGSA